MINYFFFPDSYREIEIDLIKNSIEDLNKALLKKSKNEFFYEDYSFYTVGHSDGLSLCAKLAQSHPYLTNRVVPSMLKKMRHTPTINDDITQLATDYSEAWSNSLWGWFASEDRHHIRSYNFFCSNRKSIAKGIINGMNFDDVSSLLIENVRITEKAMDQICRLGGGDNFKRVLDAICSLDSYNNSWSSGRFYLRALQQEYKLDISDESDTVKNKRQLKQQRYFNISDKIGSQYCFLHVKMGSTRMHIFPDEDERVIYIAYVGPHLDL